MAAGLYLMPTGLFCCEVSTPTALLRPPSPTAFCRFLLPTPWLAFPCLLPVVSRSRAQVFVWFRAKTDKGIVCLADHPHSVTQPLARDIRNHWITVSTLSCLISNVYHDLRHWRSNQETRKFYHGDIGQHCTQTMPNQLVVAIAHLINLNVSYKLRSYSLQRTRSPPGLRLPKMIGNTHRCNYYKLKNKETNVPFLI